MYPKLTIDMKKLKSNLDGVAAITKDWGKCSLMIVTKGVCADRNVVEMVAKHKQVDYLADSRMKNIMSYAEYARANGNCHQHADRYSRPDGDCDGHSNRYA